MNYSTEEIRSTPNSSKMADFSQIFLLSQVFIMDVVYCKYLPVVTVLTAARTFLAQNRGDSSGLGTGTVP